MFGVKKGLPILQKDGYGSDTVHLGVFSFWTHQQQGSASQHARHTKSRSLTLNQTDSSAPLPVINHVNSPSPKSAASLGTSLELLALTSPTTSGGVALTQNTSSTLSTASSNISLTDAHYSQQFHPVARIMGRFQQLKLITHPHLCRYVEILKNNKDRMFVVTETFPSTMNDMLDILGGTLKDLNTLALVAKQVLLALTFLHEEYKICCRNISLETLVLVKRSEGFDVKLMNWGLFYFTDHGRDVPFPIGPPHGLSPELIVYPSELRSAYHPEADIWSLGIVLLELYFGKDFAGIQDEKNVVQILQTVLSFVEQDPEKDASSLLDGLLDKVENSHFQSFLRECLQVDPLKRPCARELLSHPFLNDCTATEFPSLWAPRPFLMSSVPPLDIDDEAIRAMSSLHLNQIFHLWKLSISGNLDGELTKQGISAIPSMDRLPKRLVSTGDDFETILAEALPQSMFLYSEKVHQVDLEPFIQKLVTISHAVSSQSIEFVDDIPIEPLPHQPFLQIQEKALKKAHSFTRLFSNAVDQLLSKNETTDSLSSSQNSTKKSEHWKYLIDWTWEALSKEPRPPIAHTTGMMDPLVNYSQRVNIAAKEKDVCYQYSRIVCFHELLAEYPLSKAKIESEALLDIPPLLRGKIWAALLHVKGDPEHMYADIDIETELAIDRQLDLDIPRCHQYNELLSSPTGHTKMRRVLKAWIVSEENRLVYWQGLDSVCAPFVCLNFNEEALAFASFRLFLNRFSGPFFAHDNSDVIAEYMCSFHQLISFHDPELSYHLADIGLRPELYAIPWFMTLFAHVLPLDKIYYLWDNFLVGPPFAHLYAGLAIIEQLRDSLIHKDFNTCMIIFSELPVLDIEMIIYLIFEASRLTPPSLLSHLGEIEDRKQHISDVDRIDLPKYVPVQVRRNELAGRISLHDFASMKKLSLVLDVREKYFGGHVKQSLHIPLLDHYDALLVSLRIISQRTRFVVVICDEERSPEKLVNTLVSGKFMRVCILDTSFEGLQLADPDICDCMPTPNSLGVLKCNC